MKTMINIYGRAMIYARNKSRQGQSLLFATAGLIMGGIITTLVIKSLPVSMKPLEEARKLGIVSRTILDKYPKHQEVINYIVGIVLTVFIGVVFWLLWAVVASRKIHIDTLNLKTIEKHELQGLTEGRNNWPFIDYFAIPLVIIISTFSFDYFFSSLHSWTFFAEEGLYLSAVNSILQGQVLYKDIFYPYGPLMIYPIAALMLLFGKEALTLRVYTYILSLFGFFIIYISLRKLLRSKLLTIIFFFIFILFYFPYYPAPNWGSPFRVMIGLLPIFLVHTYFYTRRSLIFLAGVLAGIVLFFSQEIGLISILTFIITLTISSINIRTPVISIIRNVIIFAVGIIAVAIPILAYFVASVPLSDFLNNFIGYPWYVMSGYGSLPFPNLLVSLKDVLLNLTTKYWYSSFKHFIMIVTVFYWPIFLYIGVSAHLIIRFISRSWNQKDNMIFGILIFGILLFRSALGRSLAEKILWCSPPALFLVAVYSESIFGTIKTSLKNRLKNKKVYELVILCSIMIFFGAGLTGFAIWPARYNIKNFIFSKLSAEQRNSIKRFIALRAPPEQRAKYIVNKQKIPIGVKGAKNICAPQEWASRIKDVVEYIKSHTIASDYIYAFPNEGMYYFLIGKVNPSRFSQSHNAVTKKDRLDLIGNLASKKPKYVIYTLDSLDLDDTPGSTQVPEIVAYINKNYALEKKFGETNILRRIE